jgi:hypothetical protein
MNERIKLLAEQATTYIDPSANDGVCWYFDKEKFAQLIVGECIKMLADNSEFRSCVIIAKHFGVEE